MASDYVLITDRFTRTSWQRKIGNGPWENMPLVNGKVPVIFLNPSASWAELTSMHSTKELPNGE